MLKIALLVILSFNVTQYEREFYQNPTSSNRVFTTLIAYYRSHNNYHKILELTSYGLKKHPDDWQLARYHVEALLRLNEQDSAIKFSEAFFSHPHPRPAYKAFYSQFYFRGQRELALKILRNARRAYNSDSLFAREFYYDALWNKNFEGALYELLNFYLQTHSITILRQEFSRLERFLDEKSISSVIKKWLARHPGHNEVYLILADFYMRHDRPELMLMALKRSGWTKTISNYVKYLISVGMIQEANSLLNKAQKDGNYYFFKGIILAREGKFTEAIKFYKKAYTKFKVREARDSLLTVAFRTGDYKTVLKFADKNKPELRLKALLALNMDSAFKTFAHRNLSDASLYYLGLYFLVMREKDSSDVYWDKLATKYPASPYLHHVFFYREIIDNFGKSALANVFFKAESLVIRRDLETARVLLMRELANDTIGLLHYELARLYLEMDKPNEAFSEFTNTGDKFSNFISPFSYFRAFIIARDQLRDMELAKDVAKKLISKYPTSPYASAMRALL